MLQAYLKQRFGREWAALTAQAQTAVLKDFREMCEEEYDVGDPTCGDFIETENVLAASQEYQRRIGGGNLAAYAACLLVHRENGGTR